jgi:GT2 family glycosyltransferase
MYVAVRVLQVGYNMVYAADACIYHSHFPRNRSWTGWSVRFSGCRARHNDAD